MKNLKLSLVVFILSILSFSAQAKVFALNDTIFIGFPASNIKDDAYIIGIVRKVTESGDYQIAVRDFVEGHDYGISCQPIDIGVGTTSTTAPSNGWEIWQDTKDLSNKQLEFIVPADKAMKLSTGQFLFIERYNIYIVYSRWKSDAPVMPVEQLEIAQDRARKINMEAINPAFDIAILSRLSSYDSLTGRPLYLFESIKPLTNMLDKVSKILNEDPKLDKLWRTKNRDWRKTEEDMRTYFLIDAIDKVVSDAYYIATEPDLDKADPKDLRKLKQQLEFLGYSFSS